MLKDFAKLMTFLTVVREKSFSKASAKLGISQPAVTQQIKFIEDYLDTRVVERKKNGIKLTKEGEDLFRIATKLEKAIQSSEKELLKIISKEFTFIVGASYAIGNYVLPSYIGQLKEKINMRFISELRFRKILLINCWIKRLILPLSNHRYLKRG
jgi:DNA-binding transcriptional LysR family regulator